MDDLISILLLGGIAGVIGIFAYYVVRTYLVPKRVEELADMIRGGHVGPAISKLVKMIEEKRARPLSPLFARRSLCKTERLASRSNRIPADDQDQQMEPAG